MRLSLKNVQFLTPNQMVLNQCLQLDSNFRMESQVFIDSLFVAVNLDCGGARSSKAAL